MQSLTSGALQCSHSLVGPHSAVLSQHQQVASHLVGGLITGVLQGQVHHGVLQSAAHVELQGDVVHTLGVEEKGIECNKMVYVDVSLYV